MLGTGLQIPSSGFVYDANDNGTSLVSPAESHLLGTSHVPPPLPQPQPRIQNTSDSGSSAQESGRASGGGGKLSPGQDQTGGGSSGMSLRNRLSFGRLGRRFSNK